MSVVDDIKGRLDIVDVISAYVSLKKAGRNFKGLCPFHTEKTPSFVVFPDNQSWHCFGSCGTGGDLFSFIMQKEKLDFGEALQVLAQRAGIELTARGEEVSPEEQVREQTRQVLQVAAAYFHNLLLNSPAAQMARDYVGRRGLDGDTISRFQLGYALNDWEALKRAFLAQGYTTDHLLAAGLLIHNEERGSTYDRFRQRLMIPICDVQGRVIGFGARAFDDTPPKYLNSPQTVVFDKGRVLYGLDQARRAIRDSGHVVIVEGYMDVLAAHQAGERNVVASMGTALTETQLRQLKRYTNEFILALDADDAGNHATIRGVHLARQALEKESVAVPTASGMVRQEARLAVNVRVMTLPQGFDPDDLIRHDVQQWRALVKAAAPLVDFLFGVVVQENDLSTAKGKATVVRELVPLIQELADPIERTHYVQRLARLTQVDERTIQREIERQTAASKLAVSADRQARVSQPAAGAAVAPVTTPRPGEGMAGYVLQQVLLQPRLLGEADRQLQELGFEPLHDADFGRSEQRTLLQVLTDLQRRGETWQLPALAEDVPPFLQAYLADLVRGLPIRPSLALDQAAHDLVNAVLRLRQVNLQQRLQELRYLQANDGSGADGVNGSEVDYRLLVETQRQELGKLQMALSRRSLLSQSSQRPSPPAAAATGI
jgi:DNA primase